MAEDIILSVQNLTKVYPGVTALNRVSVEFRRGEVHALCGENGAGKSTFIKAVAGAIEPTEGTIEIEGKRYSAITPAQSRGHGIEVIYQEFNLVPDMSISENIFLGGRVSGKRTVDYKGMREATVKLFSEFGLNIDPDAEVKELSPALQQLVEILKAVSKNVRILIMDEPTAPLTVSEVEILYDIVDRLKKRGVTIIYISHRLEEVFRLTDRVTVFKDGCYVDTVKTSETDRTGLIRMMVGHDIENEFVSQEGAAKDSEVVLKVENLSGNGVCNVSFELHRGEILGFAGLVGCGRTEIMQVLYGAVRKESGRVLLNGKEARIRSPKDAIDAGIGMIPEDRKNHGVFLTQSISWNISFPKLKQLSHFTVVNKKAERQLAESYEKMLDIRTPSLEQHAGNLSGGNQQKVVIAKTLAAGTKIIIFDEPTRGIDVGAKSEIYKLMHSLIAEGHSIIMISSEMDELLGMSDRLVVLCEGRMMGTLEKNEMEKARILDLASGNR
ncbi:sugar ABC transporter ATP-binding protein [uncultured Oscillibacter sp.]|uniref:sugar ABC transporter ATP-binding protein n=1 Tax=uncultured Oscillibacter sp. TaxID=876091 RepID=UPI0026248867|nr:sugar ABC transporter ATP-binding protein [uncultured Oscillibacter sp.]